MKLTPKQQEVVDRPNAGSTLRMWVMGNIYYVLDLGSGNERIIDSRVFKALEAKNVIEYSGDGFYRLVKGVM